MPIAGVHFCPLSFATEHHKVISEPDHDRLHVPASVNGLVQTIKIEVCQQRGDLSPDTLGKFEFSVRLPLVRRSGAPYGYRYLKKTDGSDSCYVIDENEVPVVRQVYQWYTEEGLSLGAIARRLTEQGVPTRRGKARWERLVVWAMLRNPAYVGRAAYGKTGGSRGRCGRGAASPNVAGRIGSGPASNGSK